VSRLRPHLQRGAELVAAAIFAAMFGAFLLQVFMRYVVNQPPTWTLEVCVIAYVWIAFWGCAFLVNERDHIAFNLFYVGAPAHVRRVLAVLATLAIGAAFVVALGPTYDFVSFMAIDVTWVLEIRFDLVFSIFLAFMVMVIARALWRLLRLLGPGWRDAL